MKIAVTSDLHLTSREKHPERFQVLESVLKQMAEDSIQHLVLAGDVFDAAGRNYAEFDAVCRKVKSAGIQVWIIPGNHDPGLKQSSFTADNVTVFEKPVLNQIGATESDFLENPILFVPYDNERNFGDVLADFSDKIAEKKWFLVGHGDWIEGVREPNPYEKGVYMPLGRHDVEKYKPNQVILGHIHKPTLIENNIIHYCGSPCSIDINETGRRRFLILDTDSGLIEERIIHNGPIYFKVDLLVMPIEDEISRVQKQIQQIIDSWELTSEEKNRVSIRVTVRGYSADIRLLSKTVWDAFKELQFYNDEGPKLEVSSAYDTDRAEIVKHLETAIDNLGYISGADDPDRDTILFYALKSVYGDK